MVTAFRRILNTQLHRKLVTIAWSLHFRFSVVVTRWTRST